MVESTTAVATKVKQMEQAKETIACTRSAPPGSARLLCSAALAWSARRRRFCLVKHDWPGFRTLSATEPDQEAGRIEIHTPRSKRREEQQQQQKPRSRRPESTLKKVSQLERNSDDDDDDDAVVVVDFCETMGETD